ncbi:MAG: hypothetical protein ACI9BF_000070 [Candidatus Paceibacteria bacterium]|jgi:hypothetical protein
MFILCTTLSMNASESSEIYLREKENSLQMQLFSTCGSTRSLGHYMTSIGCQIFCSCVTKYLATFSSPRGPENYVIKNSVLFFRILWVHEESRSLHDQYTFWIYSPFSQIYLKSFSSPRGPENYVI